MTRTLIVLLLTVPLFAQTKQPWEWTDEERIARRVDPGSIRERATRLRSEDGSGGLALNGASAERPLVVSGRHTPELFLPWELLNVLTHSVDSASAKDRDRFSAAIRDAGWDEATFWATVRDVTRPYWRMELEALALQKQLQTAGRSDRRALAARLEELQLAACGARADAVAKAEARLGTAFRTFLYRSVAPTLSTTSSYTPEVEAQRLRYLTGGCR